MPNRDIAELEREIFDLTAKLNELRKSSAPQPVPEYRFAALDGEVTLLELFGCKERLLAIHNMGQGCRYCTLWADGLNGLLPHLESVMSVVLLSRDPPQLQRDFAIPATGGSASPLMAAGRTSVNRRCWRTQTTCPAPCSMSARTTRCSGRTMQSLARGISTARFGT